MQGCVCDLSSSGGMNGSYSNASASSSSSLDSSNHDTEDDQAIATILAEEEKVKVDRRLGKRLSHLDSIPVMFLASHYVYNVSNSRIRGVTP